MGIFCRVAAEMMKLLSNWRSRQWLVSSQRLKYISRKFNRCRYGEYWWKKKSFLYLFAPARRAPVLLLDDDTVPLTVRALRLHLLRHSGGDLVVHHFEPSSLAPWTLFEVLAPAPLSPARGANHVFAQLQFGRFAVVQVLERHFQRVDGVFAFVPPPVRPPEPAEAPEQTAAEQVREQAVTPEAVLRPLLHPLEAILVVNLPLLRVGQDLVRVRDLLELVPGLGILVGVEFFR
jgi:hypothetical protein